MFNIKFGQSIRFRFLVVIAGISLTGTVILSTVIATNEIDMVNHHLTTKGQDLASYMAKLSLDPLIMKNGMQLDSIVNEAIKDEDILYAVVQDAKGGILTSQYASIDYQSQKLKDFLRDLPKDSEIPDIIAALKKSERIAELSMPIVTGADVVGKVTIGMEKHDLDDLLLMTVPLVAALNLAIAFAVGVVFFVYSRKLILDPLVELAQASTRLAGGDLSLRVGTRSRGEMQILIDSFNRMAEDLGKRTEEASNARDAAEASSRVKSDFIKNMSHEIRTPLNAIIGFSEVLLDPLTGTLSEKQKEYANDIRSSGRILQDLALNVLRFSETESGRTELKMSRFPLRVMLNSSLAAVKDDITVRQRDVSVVMDPDADIEIEADAEKLRLVLDHLLSNALKFTPEGGSVRVSARRVRSKEFGVGSEKDSPERKQKRLNSELRTQNSELDGDFLEISVADTGIGIKPEDLPKLFREFTQLEAPLTKKYRGAGLGLALAKKLVELHNGRIWVESEFGKGSTFAFLIPVKRSE